LRKPKKSEDRVIGTIDDVECSTGATIFNVRSGGRPYKFIHASGQVDLSRFTVASSQLSLRCGSGPIGASAILTFVRLTRSDGIDGELKAIEFVPDGFIP
jgi:hypothetical protein